MSAKTFKDLLVRKKAHAYVLEIYRITNQFPKSEIFEEISRMLEAYIRAIETNHKIVRR